MTTALGAVPPTSPPNPSPARPPSTGPGAWEVDSVPAKRWAEEPHRILTPEAVELDLPVAGVPSRTFAKLIDLVAQMMIASAMSFLTVFVSAVPEAATYVSAGTGLVIFLVYPVGIEWLMRGRSIGKAAVGLRVVTSLGGPIKFRHAAVRGVVGLFEVYATFGAVAVVSSFLSSRSQRLGDRAAGTYVVSERVGATRSMPVLFPIPAGYEHLVATLDTSMISERQYSVIRAFLLRVKGLDNSARFEIASRLGDEIVQRLNYALHTPIAPETFLVCVCAAYQQREGGLAAVGWEAYADVRYYAGP